jgi:hypothetical protein
MYTAPGTTRLTAAAVTLAYSNKLLAHHCFDVGFRDAAGTVLTHQEYCKPVHPPDSEDSTAIALVDAGATSKVLYVRIRVDCGGADSCARTIPTLDPLRNGAFVRVSKVDMTLVDEDNPNASPSGPLYDLAFRYVNGTQSYDLTTAATDAGSGVQRAWVTRVGDGEIAAAAAPCDPTHHTDALDALICPESFSFTASVSMASQPEGRVSFAVAAADVAGNVGRSDPWPVFVDRTAPVAVGGSGFSGSWFDPSTGDAAVAWDDGVDPGLPDGSPGSGIDGYEYRAAVGGGAWSDWTPSDQAEALVPNVARGDQVRLEVRATDAVGNASAAVAGTVAIDTSTPAPPDDALDAPTTCKDGDASACDASLTPGTAGQLVRAEQSRAAAAAPPTTRSIYEHQATTSILDQQGCAAARTGRSGVVILAFGRPAFDGVNYGTIDYDGVFVSNVAIRAGSRAFAHGFTRCAGIRGARVKVAVGTTNGCVNGQDNECCPSSKCGHQVPNFTRFGVAWQGNVQDLAVYIAAKPARKSHTAARGADDAEPAWEPDWTRTRDFVDGYNSDRSSYPLYDFGSGEHGFWSTSRLYHIAYSGNDWPFPQVYLTTMAEDWQPYADYNGPLGKMYFVGVLSQYKLGEDWRDPNGTLIAHNCGLSPDDGRRELLKRIPQSSIPYVSNIVCKT